MRRFLRRLANLVAALFDHIREPGWPRRIVVLVLLGLLLCIPYPLSITADFEVISVSPKAARNKAEGTIIEVLVKMDDEVKEGQIVARLLDVELKLDKTQVEAELAEAAAGLRLHKNGYRVEEVEVARLRVSEMAAVARLRAADLTREQTLFEAKISTAAQLDAARTAAEQARSDVAQANQDLQRLKSGYRREEIDQAEARVSQLEARRAEIEQQLEWTAIRAPQAGRVVTPDHELQKLIGTFVPRGTPLVEIVDAETLVARVDVPERELGDVELEQTIALRSFQHPTRTFEGTVDEIHPFVDNSDQFSSVVPLHARVTDPDWRLLRVHSRGKAKISLGYSPVGFVIYRRVLRSVFVRVWSWY